MKTLYENLVEPIVKKTGISFPYLNCPNKPIIKLASTGSFILIISKIIVAEGTPFC